MFSPVCSGKLAASTIWSARLDSPLPVSSSASVLVPTMPPSTVAMITKANQPRIAFLRCCALQRPARAAKFRDCIWGAPPGERWRPTGTPRSVSAVASPSHAGPLETCPAVSHTPEGEADRVTDLEQDDQQDDDDDQGADPDIHAG